MAFGKGKESTQGGGSSFVKHMGIGTFEIAAINPNEKEYEQLFGRAPQQELNYVTERDGVKTARVCVYLRNTTGGPTSNFITQVNFFLDGQVKKSQNGKVKVIDKYGNCRWIDETFYNDKKVPLDANGNKIVLDEGYRACCGDEDLLVKLLRAYLCLDRPDEYVDGHWAFKSPDKLIGTESMLEHIKDYFKGDFKELNEIVKLQPNNKIQALLGIRKNEEGREFQDVFKHHFMQSWETSTKQLEYQLGQNKDYSYKNTTFELAPLHEWISNVTPTNFATSSTTATPIQQPTIEENPDDDLPF